MSAELTPAQWRIVQAGRKAMADTIAAACPDDDVVVPLVATAIVGAFADVVSRAAVTSHAEDLVAVVNRQLVASGFELVAIRRT